MFKRTGVLVAVCAIAVCVFAGDVWKDKDYKQWDEKDVQKILFDSPWAKSASVARAWGGAGMTGGDDEGGAALPRGGTADGRGGFGVDSTRGGDTLNGAGAPRPSAATFLVRWVSAHIIREAIARDGELHGAKPEDAEKFLDAQITQYAILVGGTDLRPFGKADDEVLAALKQAAYLEPQKSKQRIAPSKVGVQRDPKTQRLLAVIFEFDRKTPAGEPVIAAGEKEIQFTCVYNKLSLKQKFDLTKMTDKQGLDL